MKNKLYILTILLLGMSYVSIHAQVDTITEDSSETELVYDGHQSNSDLLTGITASTTGTWNTAIGLLTDGIHGGTASSGIQGSWTSPNATAEYDLGTGANGTGYDLTSIVSIAAWNSAGYGNQGWTIEVQPVGGSYTPLYTVLYEPIDALGLPDGHGATKVILESSNGKLTTGIEKIRITANSINGGLFSGRFVWRELDVFGVDTPANCESSFTQLTYQGDVSTSDLLHGITPSISSGWNTGNDATVAQLTDGVHGAAGLPVEGAWTTVGATATYDLGLGPNGTGYDLNSIVSIADWESVGFGNQNWTIEVQPIGGSYTTLDTGDCQPLTDAGTTKIIKGDGSTVLASGIQKIRITANEVNGGDNGGAFVWRELDVFGVATAANCDFSLTPLTYQGDVSNSDLLTGITPTNITGWNTDDGATVSQLTDGVHGDDFAAAGNAVEGAYTTVGATATYNLGTGDNGTGYDLNLIVSIADWFESGYGDQNWTIEVQPVGGSYTTLHTRDCQPLTDAGTTKVVVGDGSAVLASGIQNIRITANAVNGGGFVWRELDIFGVATPAVTCVLNIMPMGDSITAGYTDNPTWSHQFNFGYRSDLYTLLVDSGIEVEYMGSSTEPWASPFPGDPTNGGTNMPDPDLRAISQDNHHGYGGQTASYLNANIATWLAAEEPEIILLKIGTNSQDQSGLNTLVSYITTNKPDIHVIVAQIMPKISYQTGIVNYNNYIKNTLVPLYQGQGKNVTTVDLYAPFLTDPGDLTSIDTSLFSNGINHPDADGYNLMAYAWQEAINALGLSACVDPCINGATTEFIGGTWNNGTPNNSMKAIISSNYNTTTNGNLDACSVSIDNGITVTIAAGDYMDITNDIVVNGSLIIEHEGSLVQEYDDAIVTNNGTIQVIKTTSFDDPLDFSILGSPMTEATRGVEYGTSTLVKYHNTNLFSPNEEVAAYDIGAVNFADDNGDNWITQADNDILTPGEGYLVRPSAAGGDFTTTYTTGTLNNGVFNYTAIYNTPGLDDDANKNASLNVLANPYASAIRIDDFLEFNDNAGGTLYFWEHETALGDEDYPGYSSVNYDMGDISYRNKTGGMAAVNAPGGTLMPSNLLPSGQGFAIKAFDAGTAGIITFNNSMRSKDGNDGYRNNATAIDRLYLKVANDTYGLKGQTLIGFTELATDGFDQNYDSKRMATPISLYSLNSGRELGIQGRSAFNDSHVVPLGFTTHVEENQIYKISINSIEGDLISNATVYLKDNLLNTLTNLSETDYSFTSNEGHQTNRFAIVFESEPVLDMEDLELNAISVYPNPTQNILNIVSPLTEIKTVDVYDLRGRKINSIDFNTNNNYQVDLSNLKSALYFIKIYTESGSITKKVVKK